MLSASGLDSPGGSAGGHPLRVAAHAAAMTDITVARGGPGAGVGERRPQLQRRRRGRWGGARAGHSYGPDPLPVAPDDELERPPQAANLLEAGAEHRRPERPARLV